MNERHQLEEKLQYKFNNKKLLMTAVTHSSYVKEHCHEEKSNERLEFLGDAFFDAIIGEELFHIFPQEEEGFLSRIRATLVCEKSLAQEAKKLELGQYLLLGNGAVYLDGGFEAVKDCVLRLFACSIEDARHGKYIITDYKTALQEKLQSRGITDIKYRLVKEIGPDHDKTFIVQLIVNGRPVTKGRGKSKKQAEQQAAEEMMEREMHVL